MKRLSLNNSNTNAAEFLRIGMLPMYRTHLTSFAGVLGFEVSRYFAINDRACLTKLFFARTGIKPASCKTFGFRNRSQMGSIKVF
jgi:NOL1/NOP2/fmu family ribosome biogenesis protein